MSKGAEEEVTDIMLTRYACYPVAQNGDPQEMELSSFDTKIGIGWQNTWKGSSRGNVAIECDKAARKLMCKKNAYSNYPEFPDRSA